ncbi:MAG: sulfurtransferase [Bacteroidota bacterium]
MKSPILSVTELADLLGQATLHIIDCRHELSNLEAGREAYLVAHLPGARHLHLDEDLSGAIIPGKTGRHPLPEMADFVRVLVREGVTPNSVVVAYDDKGGGIAARLWWMLRAIGHEKVFILDGGIQAWRDAGLALEDGPERPPATGAPYPAPSTFPGTCDRAQLTNGRPLIDSRTAPRYRGEHEPIDPVAGHIPGAVNYPWPENLRDGHFKSREELKIRFAALHDEADRPTFYCGSGVTACHNLLAYEYAYGELATLYPGSWSEWLIYENKGEG